MTTLDTFVLISGTFSVLSVLPLTYLALRSMRDAKDLRRIQYELADLITETKEISEEVHELQREIQGPPRRYPGVDEHVPPLSVEKGPVEEPLDEIAAVWCFEDALEGVPFPGLANT